MGMCMLRGAAGRERGLSLWKMDMQARFVTHFTSREMGFSAMIERREERWKAGDGRMGERKVEMGMGRDFLLNIRAALLGRLRWVSSFCFVSPFC